MRVNIVMHPPGLNCDENLIGLVVVMVRAAGMCFCTMDCRDWRVLNWSVDRLCSERQIMSVSMLFILSSVLWKLSNLFDGLIPLMFV